MLYQTTEGKIQLGKTSMDYAAFGTGLKTLLLIPGLSLRGVKGAGLSLAWMYRQFVKDYRVYVLDRRSTIAGDCTIWDLADDVVEAMDALDIPCADVVGISQGGMIAQALAIRHQQRVSKLVLGVTAPCVNDTLRRVVGGWIDAGEKNDWRTINREGIILGYSEAFQRKMRWMLPLAERLVKPVDGRRFIHLARSILTFDALNELDQIICPVMVLGGKQDRITTGDASLELAERLHCDIYMYDDLGHAAYDEAKDFNQKVLSFLRKG